MTLQMIRSSDPWDLEEHEGTLQLLGYREVDRSRVEPGEYRKISEMDEDEHRPVVTLEWEDGARE